MGSRDVVTCGSVALAAVIQVASITAPGMAASPATTPIPDDKPWIVYQGADGLRLVRSDGTGVHRLFGAGGPPDPAHADWSPDGLEIAFQAGVDGGWDIWIADADGSDARVLVDCAVPCINMDSPAWSPDGRSIAFSELDETGPDELPAMLQVLDVDSGVITTVATTRSGDYVDGPRWSPDGRSIAVTWEDHVAPDGGLVGDPVGSTVAIIDLDDPEPAFHQLTPLNERAWYPAWHPIRDLIVFQAGPWDPQSFQSGMPNLYGVRPDGSELSRLTDFGPDDPVVWMPSWTPDGSAMLVTMTDRLTGEHSLGRLRPDGSGLEVLPGPVGGAHARQQPIVRDEGP